MEIIIHEIAPPIPGRADRGAARLTIEALEPGQAVTFRGLTRKQANSIQSSASYINWRAQERRVVTSCNADRTEITVWRLEQPLPLKSNAKPAR